MSIIHKYIIKEIIRYVAIVIILVTSIFVLNDFLGTINNFANAGIPLIKGFWYVLLRVPFFISTILPVSTILSVLIVYGLMQKNKELVAIKSGGVSTMYINLAALFTGLIFTVFLFIVAEIITPMTLLEANKIRPRHKNVTYNWVKTKKSITHVRYYEPSTKKVSGLSIYYFGENFKLVKRIDAKVCIYDENKDIWHMKYVITQTIDNKGDFTEVFNETKDMKLALKPESLKNVVRKNRALSSEDLKKMIRKMEDEGYDAVGYRVDYHGKLAMPFVCIIMVIMATLITTLDRVGKSIPLSILTGLIIWFLHWSLHSLFLSLGKGEVLPPVMAAWLANFLFFSAGSYLVVKRSSWV
ncbi:MAG: LPS export ABC transporter permease LptG [Desulfobacterales bacterium]|nr:LPS export ABC transporter permease LptG [Desulfobacterales bacterium]MCP4160708.1 LPS export ABC transporter permease LptG [Deltaproteobacteria bacterium]